MSDSSRLQKGEDLKVHKKSPYVLAQVSLHEPLKIEVLPNSQRFFGRVIGFTCSGLRQRAESSRKPPCTGKVKVIHEGVPRLVGYDLEARPCGFSACSFVHGVLARDSWNVSCNNAGSQDRCLRPSYPRSSKQDTTTQGLDIGEFTREMQHDVEDFETGMNAIDR